MLEGKLTCISFPSLYNFVIRNAFVLVRKGKLTCVRIPSWCNVFDGNVVVPVGMLTYTRFYSPCNVVRNALVFVLEGTHKANMH